LRLRPAGLALRELRLRPAGLALRELRLRPAGLALRELRLRPAGLALRAPGAPASIKLSRRPSSARRGMIRIGRY